MKTFRITYTFQLPIHELHDGEEPIDYDELDELDERGGCAERITIRNSIASASNLVHRCHQSFSRNLIKFEMVHQEKWYEYDMPYTDIYQAIRKRINEIAEFHDIFYAEDIT